MKFLQFLPLFVSLGALAAQSPKSFSIKEGKAVFVDFKEAIYNINYDLSAQSANVSSKITFENLEEGMAIFDLVATPTKVLIDGEVVSEKLTSTPNSETQVRIALKNLKPGLHELEVFAPLTNGVRFTDGGVSSAFWTSDLSERSFMEAYIPTNLEFDQFKAIYNVEFKNKLAPKQRVFTNGVLTKNSEANYTIEFPEYFNTSSPFFHTAPVGRYPETSFTYKSKDGRDLPVVIYTVNGSEVLEGLKAKTIKVLDELEADYGPFAHPSVTIFNAGAGGMEYCGATMTDSSALGHELTHSYFARGFMPANGNAGWIDESIASWRDKGYQQISDLGWMSTSMAAHPEYTRITDRAAYSSGARFMGYLNYKFQDKGGLKSFLAELVEKYKFQPMLTEEFVKLMSEFYGTEMMPTFKKYVYGQGKAQIPYKSKREENPMHMKMTIEQMAKFL
jgi:hypothetical protein